MNKREEIKNRIDLINKGEVPKGYKRMHCAILPSEWNEKSLESLCIKRTEKAGNKKLETLSISAGIGFVNQAQKFGRELSGKQYEQYTVINKGDFAYNKGNSKKYPQGCIYQLEDRKQAAVPNVFNTFKLTEICTDEYYKHLFKMGFLNKQLYKFINFGVRNDIYLPKDISEQTRIVNILSEKDKEIELLEQELEQYKQLKKSLSQLLLTGIVRVNEV